MNRLLRNLAGVFVLTAASISLVQAQTAATVRKSTSVNQASQRKQPGGRLIEEFSFVLSDLKMVHQGDTNSLDIAISYRYVAGITKAQYPDFRWLAKDVENLLANYPNKDDYWEIVNKQITSWLLTKYPAITSVVCDLKVAPTQLVPYARSSRVTRTRTRGQN